MVGTNIRKSGQPGFDIQMIGRKVTFLLVRLMRTCPRSYVVLRTCRVPNPRATANLRYLRSTSKSAEYDLILSRIFEMKVNGIKEPNKRANTSKTNKEIFLKYCDANIRLK